MKALNEMDLQRAFEMVRSQFPFPNYIDDMTYRSVEAIATALGEYFPECAGLRLLDLGSGPMDKTAVFQQLGFVCCAVDDLSDAWHRRDGNLEKIIEFARKAGIQFVLQGEGNHDVPFPRESFDVVGAFDVIEHFHESPRGILNTMGEMLKPDGILVVTMPNAVNIRKRLSVVFGKTNYVPVDQFYHADGPWRGHVREYTLAEAVYICQQSGFTILQAKAFESFAFSKFPRIAPLFVRLSEILPTLRSSLLVVCRKPQTWRPCQHDPEYFRQVTARSVPEGVA